MPSRRATSPIGVFRVCATERSLGRPPQALTQYSGRTHEQYEHQDSEGHHVDVRGLHEGVRKALGYSQQESTKYRTAKVADAAQDGSGEGLEGRHKSHGVHHATAQSEEETGRSAERSAENERQRNRAIDIDAHERRGFGVLSNGSNASSQFRFGHQSIQRYEHDHAGNQYDD